MRQCVLNNSMLVRQGVPSSRFCRVQFMRHNTKMMMIRKTTVVELRVMCF